MSEERMIDGVRPDRWLCPDSEAAVAEAVREANLTGDWILPAGGRTALNAANPVDRVPIALDTTALTGVREYEPADLTVSVAAGTRWADLQAALRENGQTIPVDVPCADRATVGGVVATGYAGPRRLRDGTLKDLLLGASFVRGDGLSAKAGGMVVKNVSGFEIPRLLHGSWGALALITSVNLKVIPRHEFEMTIVTTTLDLLEAAERVLDLTRARSAIASAVVDGTLEEVTVAVRLTGREHPTRALAGEVQPTEQLPWDSHTIDGSSSERWWQDREDQLSDGEDGKVRIEVGCQPSEVLETLGTLRTALPHPGSVGIHASPGIGAIGLAFDAGLLSLDTLARIWSEHGLESSTRVMVTSAPSDWRRQRDVWFIPPASRSIMSALKGTFDPHDTLNRERLWAAPRVAQPDSGER
jgi:glycolate oxidase FAD binding subunit